MVEAAAEEAPPPAPPAGGDEDDGGGKDTTAPPYMACSLGREKRRSPLPSSSSSSLDRVPVSKLPPPPCGEDVEEGAGDTSSLNGSKVTFDEADDEEYGVVVTEGDDVEKNASTSVEGSIAPAENGAAAAAGCSCGGWRRRRLHHRPEDIQLLRGARRGCPWRLRRYHSAGCDDGVSATDPKISSCCGVLASCDDTAEDTAGVVVTASRELTAVDRPKGSSSSSSPGPVAEGLYSHHYPKERAPPLQPTEGTRSSSTAWWW